MLDFSFISWVNEKGISDKDDSQIVLTTFTEDFAFVSWFVGGVHFTL